jgi:hypothetical protein
MSAWDAYPPHYRAAELSAIFKAVQAGESVSVVGLSGAGKSNLMGFLAHRVRNGPGFILADCNRLSAPDLPALYELLVSALGGNAPYPSNLRSLEILIDRRLKEEPHRLCLLLDRFDALNMQPANLTAIAGGLRALRDSFKYSLSYVIATRRPLDPHSEAAELFYANTIWLGPLSHEDALWSATQYALRRKVNWEAETLEQIISLSWGYPSLLRAVCEAHAAGVALDIHTLRDAPAVKSRVEEFWSDHPTLDDLRHAGLEDQPLLASSAPVQVDAADLTAAEGRLLEYFQSQPGQVCAKDDLIRAVWPEERLVAGLRDDSLAQLVHRLRDKVEADPSHPAHIQTIPGRGYRYNP